MVSRTVKKLIFGVLMGNLCCCASAKDDGSDKNKLGVDLATSFKEYLEAGIQDKESSIFRSQFLMDLSPKSNRCQKRENPLLGEEAFNEKENESAAIGSESEDQKILCVDLGGTSLKMGIYEVNKKNRKTVKITEEIRKYDIPKESKAIQNRTIYEFMSEKINSFVSENRATGKAGGKVMKGALTFSYPIENVGDKVKVVKFTKQFKWAKINSVGDEIPLDELNKLTADTVQFEVIVNDTTALGAWACSTYPDAVGGFVLGTGLNCSYLETKQEKSSRGALQSTKSILNTECGASFEFGNIGKYMDEVDREMAKNILEKENAKFCLEHMVGGLYFEQYINIYLRKEIERIFEKESVKELDLKGFTLSNSRLSREKIKDDIEKLFETYLQKNSDNAGKVDELVETVNNAVRKAFERKYMISAGLMAGIISKCERDDASNNGVYRFGLTGSGCQTEEFKEKVGKKIMYILSKMPSRKGFEKVRVLFEFSEEASLIGGASAFISKRTHL
ncbi:hexokinase [Nematocida minor]|uniref:hexokinase n=1 Tax=Nematocida minor TaxID=1912983 RepID=UPI00221E52D3|nr:hexokinase [Nematocida minor]KAI5192262.1 hexokinase [Nematocida minor]